MLPLPPEDQDRRSSSESVTTKTFIICRFVLMVNWHLHAQYDKDTQSLAYF